MPASRLPKGCANVQQHHLERIRHLLHLVQIELSMCGSHVDRVRDRIDTALELINSLLEIKARHVESNGEE